MSRQALPKHPLLAALLGLVACLLAVPAPAHEVRPAYLRIQELEGERFDVLWRVPALGEMRLGIHARLPEHCLLDGQPRAWPEGAINVQRWLATCPGGLAGHTVRIDGLQSTLTDVLARYERLDGSSQVERLTPARPEFKVTASESRLQVARTYALLGIEHILLGIDHLLFVLALLLIVPGTRQLIWTVTAFTLAHSLTLAAASLGWVQVPQGPVEAVIALSILFVAVEIVHWRQGLPGLARRQPWLVAFAFGLLHGFGFAGALADIGLPEHAIPLALLFFNLGVEAGQLLFVGAVLAVWALLQRVPWPAWAWRIPVYAIGSLAAYWTLDRIVAF